MFDLGQYKSNNGAGVFANSNLEKLQDQNKLYVLESSPLSGCKFESLLYCLLRDYM